MTVAVCYVASAGYLFQTALSALQARRHSPVEVPVFVVFLTDGAASEAEVLTFENVLRREGVRVLRLDMDVLGGLSPIFGRYFVEMVLPDEVDRVLYIDGDTQILDQLGPLLATVPPPGELLACRDPMVLLRRLDRRQGAKIDQWWDDSDIPEGARDRYVNSGVFMVGRDLLSEVGADVCRYARSREELVFADQDALNVVAGERISLMSTCWNFPGFLLGTAAQTVFPPRLVHFMSQPRPWNAPLSPWGARFYEPYESLVRDEPSLRPYWQRFGRAATLRYVAQQAYKQVIERRVLMGGRAAALMLALEESVDVPTRM